MVAKRRLYQQNVTLDVKEKIESLQELYERELQLEKELEATRRRRQDFEQELRPYEATPSIDHLPAELLACIFQLTLHQHHSRIGRLLFVCRRWTQIILETAALWATIEICISKSEGEELVKPSYVRACYDRSGELPLDVVFDCESLSSATSYAAELSRYVTTSLHSHRIYSKFIALIGPEALQELFSRAFDSLGPLIRNIMTTVAVDLAGALISENGRHVRRWRRAMIMRPNDSTSHFPGTRALFAALEAGSPNLRVLRVKEFIHSLSSAMTGLKELVLDDIDEFTCGPPLSSSLLHISVLHVSNINSLTNLYGMNYLEELELDLTPCGPFGWCFVELLRLKRLTLVSYSLLVQGIEFHTPALEILRIKEWSEVPFTLPTKAETLEWWFLGWTDEFDSLISHVIATTTGSVHLRLHGFYDCQVEDYLKHQVIPPTLKTLTVVQEDGFRRTTHFRMSTA